MKKLILALALLPTAVFAAITSTAQPPQYLIRLADKTYEQNKTVPKSLQECYDRAQAIIPHADCVVINGFDNVGDCTTEWAKKPVWPLEKDANGFVKSPQFKDDGFKAGSDTEYQFLVEDFVKGEYPACWVKGWRIAELQDLNPPNGDELLANTAEPVHPPAEFEALWNSPESVAARAAYALAHPFNAIGACGDFRSVECGGPGTIPGVNDNETLGIP